MSIRIIQGDVREELPKLLADSFDCIVTSPPYYGLRSYIPNNHQDKHLEIGLEPTLDAYLGTIVAVCRELRRVLKPSGVFFLNVGDSYNGGGLGGGGGGNLTTPNANRNNQGWSRSTVKVHSLKPKDLCLVPERLGLALQADGWWVRSRIVWAKPNPMPESCTDRPTSAHETVWMLTKSAQYFWDGDAVAESMSGEPHNPGNKSHGRINDGCTRDPNKIWGLNGTRNLRNVWTIASHPFPGAHFATFPPTLVERCIKAGSSERGCCPACGKPWVRITEISKSRTRSELRGKYSDINATVKIGGGSSTIGNSNWHDGRHDAHTETIGWYPSCKCDGLPMLPSYPPRPIEESERGAWEEACAMVSAERKRLCGIAAPFATAPARILDPFAGSGTVGLVADRLGRDATLIDLNTEYIDMAVNRIRDDAPLFAEVAAE